MKEKVLKGRSILLVEDEYFQAKECARLLKQAGAQIVGPTAHAEDVASLLASHPVDATILDVNLGQGANFELARNLRDADLPFLFLTGYDSSAIPSDLSDIPRLAKPANDAALLERLVALAPTR